MTKRRATVVRDFNSLRDLIEHARNVDGATFVLPGRKPEDTKLYYSIEHGDYVESRVWKRDGYWHQQGPSARKPIRSSQVPRTAVSINVYLQQNGGTGHRPQHHHHAHEAAGKRAGRRSEWRPGAAVKMDRDAVLRVARELSRRAHGTAPKYIEGGHRWSDRNESAIFTTHSPEHRQPVAVLVSVFQDGHIALDFFSSEERSETERYENVGNFLYRGEDLGEMVADIKWVWETVDGYAESWQDGERDELNEAHGPPDTRIDWVPPALARDGVTRVMLEVVFNGLGEHSRIKPRQSVVYDRDGYEPLENGGYIVLKRKTPGLSSFGDYYVLTDKGADLERRYRLEVRKLGGQHGAGRTSTREAPRSRSPRLDAFTRAYVEAALWSTNDESDERGGEPLDKNYGVEDIAPETMELIVEDCADFQERFGRLIEDDDPKVVHGEYDRWEKAGHDFWLTREGHGAGFWDGDWPKHGDELTEAAKSYGEFELYVGDDGAIYGPDPEQYRNPPEWLAKRHPSRARRRS